MISSALLKNDGEHSLHGNIKEHTRWKGNVMHKMKIKEIEAKIKEIRGK